MDRNGTKAQTEIAEGALLVVDIGNTQVKLGLAQAGALKRVWCAKTVHGCTRDEALSQIMTLARCPGRVPGEGVGAPHRPQGGEAEAPRWNDAIVASVVPDLTDAWVQACAQLTGRRPLVVGPGIKTGVPMSYNDPGELGADIIADLAAATVSCTPPFIVVDLGTTTTFMVVDGKGRFVGGIIAPGLQVAASAASSAAAKLPSVDLRAPRSVIGKNTREAMQSGFVLGQAAMIDGLVGQCAQELEGCGTVVLSGQSAPAMAALCETVTEHREFLTLEGLVRLHALNR